MSVRQGLLAILAQGPCYGYQLKVEFDRRTGSTSTLNAGQIYNTLERLERDGLARRGLVDDEGHVFYEITDAGRDEVRRWLDTPVARPAGTRDELPIKIALASTLPGADLAAIIQSQRRASLARLQGLNRAKYAGATDGPEELAWSLIADSMIFEAEAEVRWLDHIEQRLAAGPPVAPLPIEPVRPARSSSPTASVRGER
ncbi:PadR family transcriptional regulator [Microbacterium sp. dk485]|uniref:PadR family transcriptional regulator n=1 Tax=Microbacterium sp. dk485 TaxID=2560021 RepID=UPI0010735E64|nr:PadR family transcriptional regulator [Microbacterium sp. dk485]TFV83744.1 PadR family transcriptional regulator [Microbacterium sp. dk485]